MRQLKKYHPRELMMPSIGGDMREHPRAMTEMTVLPMVGDERLHLSLLNTRREGTAVFSTAGHYMVVEAYRRCDAVAKKSMKSAKLGVTRKPGCGPHPFAAPAPFREMTTLKLE